ncbi:hypothetical protein Tco_1307900 [Tanacetum coccineum]
MILQHPSQQSQQNKPNQNQPKEKKRKPVSESSEAPPLAKCAKAGKVVKKRTVKSSKQLVDEFIDEGVPAAKPSLEDTEEEILQKVLEESLTDAYPTRRGPLPPVVFRETDTGKFQPLPEVPGKGKEKVVIRSLMKKCLQWLEVGAQDEGQAGPNPDDVAESLPLPTPSVLAGPNLEHSDVEITDPSSQPQPEHMDEGFTAAAYPDVQENLKLTVDEQVIPEEPVSSTGTLSSLQHLAKDFSFGDQFLNDKPSEADNEKTTADTEAESMVSVTIQQDTSIIPPMTSPVIDPVPRPDSPNVHWPLPTTTTTTAAPTTTTTTTLPLPPQPQQGSSDSILIKRMGELEQHIAGSVCILICSTNKHLTTAKQHLFFSALNRSTDSTLSRLAATDQLYECSTIPILTRMGRAENACLHLNSFARLSSRIEDMLQDTSRDP